MFDNLINFILDGLVGIGFPPRKGGDGNYLRILFYVMVFLYALWLIITLIGLSD